MKRFINILNKSWYASLLSVVLISAFVAAIYYIWNFEATFEGKEAVIFSYGLMLVMVLCVFSAGKSSRRKLARIRENNVSLPEKVAKYHSISQKRLLLYDFVAVIAATGFLLCSQPSYLLFSAISLLLVLLSKPTETKVKMELALSEKEINDFETLKFEKRS